MDSRVVPSQLIDIASIYSTDAMFSALKTPISRITMFVIAEVNVSGEIDIGHCFSAHVMILLQ